MQSDDRAALEKVMVCMDKLRLSTSKAERDALLDLLRSALSLPDAAQVKAQARREAIEKCDEYAAALEETGQFSHALVARTCSKRIRALLSAEPAARGKEEQRPDHATRSVTGERSPGEGNLGPASICQEPEPMYRLDASPAPLDDAAVLDRAAEIAERRTMGGLGWMPLAQTLRVRIDDMNRGLHLEAQPPAPEPDVDVTDKDRMDYLESEMERELEWRKRSDLSEPCPRSLFRENNPITRKRIDEALAQLRARAKEASRG